MARVSGDNAFRRCEEVATFHRIQASTGYREAAEHVARRLRESGVETTIRRYPADGRTWCWTSKMFKEWDCRDGFLRIPSLGLTLADFRANNLSVIQKSGPCDHRAVPVEIVLLDRGNDAANYPDLDLKGKLIFVRDDFNGYLDWAVKGKGAIGIITDFMREVPGVRARYDHLDILNYTSFWWKHADGEAMAFGYVLTPRQGDQLAEQCAKALAENRQDASRDKYLKATCYMDARLYEGSIEVVDAFIPGKTDEEILITSHLCHPRPSANDNASGVSASMEAMRVLAELIREGEIEKPERSIRLILVPEFTGTYAYLAGREPELGRIKSGINMDMVGGRQGAGYGPLAITSTPFATPSLVSGLAAFIMDEARKDAVGHTKDHFVALFNTTVYGFEGGSDHVILSDPSVGIPTIMFGQWPDKNYHSGGDTMAVIDPFILKKSASICAGLAYTLACPDVEAVAQVMNKHRELLVENLARATKRDGYDAGTRDAKAWRVSLAEQTGTLVRYMKACNADMVGYFPGKDAGTVQGMVEQENRFLDALAAQWGGADRTAGTLARTGVSIPEEYGRIPVRKYRGPILKMEELPQGDEARERAYQDFIKSFRSKLHSGHSVDMVIQYNMNGLNSIWEIAKLTSTEVLEGDPEYVKAYVELLESWGYVEFKGEKR